MADAEEMKTIVPFVTCVITFGQNVCELMFRINVSNLNLESKLIMSNNQSKASLWVLDTCLIVGVRPLIIILITASCPETKHWDRNVLQLMECDQCLLE